MATSYPGALDDFTNPTSGDTLDSPSHSAQHANANDAVEAVEAKLGIGSSPAGSAVSGYVLLAQGGGTTTWSSVADTNAVVLTAGGSTILSTDADIEPLILQGGTPDIATVGSVSANGTTITYTASNTFSAGQAVRITGVNPAQFNFERAVLATAGTGDFTVTNAGTGTYVSGGTAILYQGNLQEWKDYEGNVVASVDQFGKSNLGGLVHINSTSFSAVASISLPDDTFTSTFDTYILNFNIVPSTSMNLNYRVRASGSDDSTANYDNYANFISTILNGGGNLQNSTFGRVCGTNDGFWVGTMKIYDIKKALNTKFVIDGNTVERFWFQSGGIHTVATAYDSLSFLTSTGTITGSVDVYGLKI